MVDGFAASLANLLWTLTQPTVSQQQKKNKKKQNADVVVVVVVVSHD